MGGKIHIGTSGWHYGHWVGPFYPVDMKPEVFLAHYANLFRTVEINATFYKLPEPETLARWRHCTPRDFLFACKASRYTTHRKKLKDPKQSSARFFKRIAILGDKLGPVLVQLPPRWRVNRDRLQQFLKVVPKGYRLAFEFRDESWFTQAIYDLLNRHGAALCAYDLNRRQSPIEVTAPFVYVRLHGPQGAYRGQYDERTLNAWAKRFRNWSRAGLEIYCYFDNDEAGYAVKDALRLKRMLT